MEKSCDLAYLSEEHPTGATGATTSALGFTYYNFALNINMDLVAGVRKEGSRYISITNKRIGGC